MQRIEDVLTGIMMIVSTLVVLGIACVGAFLFLKNSNLISLTLIFAIGFLALYGIRRISIGLSVIVHGRYQDDMTLQENHRHNS